MSGQNTVFVGGGQLGTLMREFDWSKTPLGPVDEWPQSLLTATSICLYSRFPIVIYWGSDFTMLYNDAYIQILGDKHPTALGQSCRSVWAEIWEFIGPMLQSVLNDGEATWSQDQPFLIDRKGFLEEGYFSFSFSPIYDELGIVGVFTAVIENTDRVIGARRLQTLRDLADRAVEAKSIEKACTNAMSIIAENGADIPFSMLYLLNTDGQSATLASTPVIAENVLVGPPIIHLADENADPGWPITTVIESGKVEIVTDIQMRFGKLPGGVWPAAPHTALVIPVTRAGQQQLFGVLIAGVSPRRMLDDAYFSFYKLVADQLSTALTNAEAFEEERRRTEALAQLDRAKTEFFSNISHEFRTPLTLIINPLYELITDKTSYLDPDLRAVLEMTYRNSLRLLKLVNTLLDFSRIQADRIEASFESTDLATLTADLASTFRSAIEKAGLRFVVDCPPLPSDTYVDREMWEKIVLNLVSNAFKFTFRGEITVILRALKSTVELEVRDTGTGIPEAEIDHIFERFYRVKDLQGRTHEGSGIGLALVRELVHYHGGQITVSSERGIGTRFVVSIPRGSSHLPSDQIHASRSTGSAAAGTNAFVMEAVRWSSSEEISLPDTATAYLSVRPTNAPVQHKARIIVVDDNADMRDYLTRLLSGRYQVEVCSDGASALARLQSQQYDLMLADVMMPGLDGFELIQQVRDDDKTRTLPIILLSARAGEEAIVEGLRARADDYLVKPFSGRELTAHIEAQLEQARLRQEILNREQALRVQAEEAQQYVTRILESISDGVAVLDREFRYTYLNSKGEEILFHSSGKTKQELLGQCIWDVYPGSEQSAFGREYRRAMDERIPTQIEDFYPPLDTWYNVHCYPSDDGIMLYFQNVTERRRSEEQMRHQDAELAVYMERQRLGRELHDSVNQTLFAANMLAGAMLIERDSHGDDLRADLVRITELTRGAMAEMRVLLMELRPESLRSAKLEHLIGQLVDVIKGHSAMEVVFTLEDDQSRELPFEIRFAFYRIVQESLNNIVKHAAAMRIDIRLTITEDTAELKIRDNGRGFDISNISPGIGMHSIRERAEAIAASVNIDSRENQGTEITVTCALRLLRPQTTTDDQARSAARDAHTD